MADRRVAITGVGIICAAGHNVPEAWDSIHRGVTSIGPITAVDSSLMRFQNGAEVRNYDPLKYFEGSRADHLDRFAQFAVIAAREAVADSGISFTPALQENTAVVCGNGGGGQISQDSGYIDLYQRAKGRVHPLIVPRTMASGGVSHVTMEFGIHGPSYAVSTACSSSNHAIGQAFQMVRRGEVELAIAGGSEAPFALGCLKAWEAMRVIAPDTCRPFCVDRRGMILGEGAGIMVLEPLEAARARGAKIYAELAGFGMSADAHHITQPTVEGPARAIRRALADANLATEQIGYINAHGTATPGNDPAETAAIREVFGPQADRLAVSSTKSMVGHALGAAGSIEAVVTIMALHEGILPPTANFTKADPACDLDYIPNAARNLRAEAALSNSFAFGGLNAVLAFRAAP
jgi:nodulation protein E